MAENLLSTDEFVPRSFLQPRMLKLKAAAEYCDMPAGQFQRNCPVQPFDLGGIILWDRRLLDEWQQVYLVGFDDYVKIGYTTQFPVRLYTLQCACPRKLNVYLLESGTQRYERELHRDFAKFRLQGEWFRLSREIKVWIAERTGVYPRGREDG